MYSIWILMTLTMCITTSLCLVIIGICTYKYTYMRMYIIHNGLIQQMYGERNSSWGYGGCSEPKFFFFSSHLMMSKPYERYIQTFANLYVHTKNIHMQSTMDLSKIMYGAYKIVADMVVFNWFNHRPMGDCNGHAVIYAYRHSFMCM